MKPLILIGQGCRGNPKLVEDLCSIGVPIQTTPMSADLIEEDHPSFVGRGGTSLQRAPNIITQKCDELWIFGARLDNDQIAFNIENYAPGAIKYVFDVDQAELDKLPGSWNKIIVDLNKCSFGELFDHIPPYNHAWRQWCRNLYLNLRIEFENQEPYNFVNRLCAASTPDDIVVITSSGFSAIVMLQAWRVKKGQRILHCATIGAMGIDIPQSIGAAVATQEGGKSASKRVICVTGDGGFMLNVQELEVVHRLNLPIHFFVLNNGGYGSIRAMQDGRFEGRHIGSGEESGLTLPNLSRIANAFRIEYWGKEYEQSLEQDCPTICEVFVDHNFVPRPKVASSPKDGVLVPDDLADMIPHLAKEVLDELLK